MASSDLIHDVLSCSLSGRDWSFFVFGVAAAGITLFVHSKLSASGGLCCSKPAKKNLVNLNVKKEDSKVVNTVDIEDIGEKKVYCRCWRSAIFPLCDGSHNKHNETTGDNVGPLIIAKKSN